MAQPPARDSISRNASVVFGGQVVTWALTALTLGLVPRYLGAYDVGVFNIGFTFATLATAVAGLGMGTLITRDVARDREHTQALFGTAAMLSIGLGAAGGGAAIGIAWALGYNGLVMFCIAVNCVVVPLGLFGVALNAGLQGLEVMRWNSALDILAKLALLLGVLICIALGGGIIELTLLPNVIALGGFGVQILVARRFFSFHVRQFSAEHARYLLRATIPFFVVSIFWVLYTSVDILLLSWMSGAASVGIYSTPMRIFGTALFIPVTITTVLFPRLSAVHQEDPARMARLADRALRITLTASLVMAIAAVGLSDGRVTALLGHSFSSGIGPVIVALSISIVPTSVSIVASRMAFAANRQAAMSWIGCGAFLAKTILGLALIPLFDSLYGNPALGAAVGLVLTELGMTGAMLGFLPRSTFNAEARDFYAKIGVTALAAGIVLAGGYGVATPLGASALAVGLFVALVVALGVYTPMQAIAAARLVVETRGKASPAAAP